MFFLHSKISTAIQMIKKMDPAMTAEHWSKIS